MQTIQKPVTVDDYGTAVYRCWETKALVWADDAVKVGSIVPGVNAHFFIANTDDAKIARALNIDAFNESEANCNTCQHMERIKHKKTSDGLLPGYCRAEAPDVGSHPYGIAADRTMKFAPADWQGMSCHVLRQAKNRMD